MYLTAIIDVYSRFIVGWSLHNSLDTSNCIEVLKTVISRYGTPEILNSDQGCQFTSKEWADACAEYPKMKASMDGCGRAKDNIWIERFWKTIKYEYIYIQPEENESFLPTFVFRPLTPPYVPFGIRRFLTLCAIERSSPLGKGSQHGEVYRSPQRGALCLQH